MFLTCVSITVHHLWWHIIVQFKELTVYVYVLEPFNTAVPTDILAPASQRVQLQREIWFHGPVSRQEAETLLTRVSCLLVWGQISRVFWNITLCRLVFICVIAQLDICKILQLICSAMRSRVLTTFTMLFSYTGLWSICSLFPPTWMFVMVAVNFRQINMFTLFKLRVCLCVSASFTFHQDTLQKHVFIEPTYDVSSGQEPVAGWCDNGNERFSAIWDGLFPDWLSSRQFLSDDCIPWSHWIIKITVALDVSWDSAFSIVTRLQGGRSRNWGLIPGNGKRLLLHSF